MALTCAARRRPRAEVAGRPAARGLDPAGVERELARATLALRRRGDARREARLSLPPELRNRITRFEIAGVRSAGAVS